MKQAKKRIVIIGGLAAGMSAASRARRNDPQAEIIVFEKSGYVSYGACGLPYFISDEIRRAEQLIAITAGDFRTKRNIDVRLHHEGLSFDPRRRTVHVKNHTQNKDIQITYDKLVIASGARAIVPPIPGKELDHVFLLRSLEDGIKIKEHVEYKNPGTGLIIGGGYIGLEMAEALTRQHVKVTLVEMRDHIMPNVDLEISKEIETELEGQGCRIIKSDGLKEIIGSDQVKKVKLMSGKEMEADMILLAVGIKPNVEFALTGGVQLGRTGAIAVNSRLQTNVIDVYAAGDCAEVKNLVSGKNDYLPLGTTANKQGRIAGDNVSGVPHKFKGTVATAALKVFELEVARCGITESYAQRLKIAYKTVIIEDKSRAAYYPKSQKIRLKLIFATPTGRLLGAQMVGKEGVAKRIDVLATALHQHMSVQEIAELDLSYAPPFAPVWDPILIAANQALKTLQR